MYRHTNAQCCPVCGHSGHQRVRNINNTDRKGSQPRRSTPDTSRSLSSSTFEVKCLHCGYIQSFLNPSAYFMP